MKTLSAFFLFMLSLNSFAGLNCTGTVAVRGEASRSEQLSQKFESDRELNYQAKIGTYTFYASHYTKLDDLFMQLVDDHNVQLNSRFVRTISQQGHDLTWTDGIVSLEMNCTRL